MMNVGHINVVLATALSFLTQTQPEFLFLSYAFSSLDFGFQCVVMSVCTMATLKFLQLCAGVALMVVGVLPISSESTLLVYFNRVPPARSRSSNAVFQYLVERLDGSNACNRNNCSFSCQVYDFS